MLHTDLLRIINSREAWALVGSGPSVDAGCPTWSGLLTLVLDRLTDDEREAIISTDLYIAAVADAKLPLAFSCIAEVIGAQRQEEIVKQAMRAFTLPGELHRLLAELPFAGYITTNYDSLLETALNAIDPGWISVGNIGDEVRMASGTADRVVWHIHGSTDLDSTRSKLVLTDDDYDAIYIDGSMAVHQLAGLLSNRRVVIIGFGFRDHDPLDLLRRVGRMTDPSRPIYGIVAKAKDFRHTIDRQVFLRQYRVDVHPYNNDDGKHRALRDLLKVYTAMSLRRSLRYGRQLVTPPSYDAETTGLLLYNDLVLRDDVQVPSEIRASLLRSRILSLGLSSPNVPLRELVQDAIQLAESLGADSRVVSEESATSSVLEAIDSLTSGGLLEVTPDSSEVVSLTDQGREVVTQHSSTARRLELQFLSSLQSRIEGMAFGTRTPTQVSQIAFAFFQQAIAHRALGIAMAFATSGMSEHQSYHALALLQELQGWLDKAASEQEALAVIETIMGVFQQPTDVESKYIGLAIQAKFGLHLLGLDADTLSVRQREVESSLFVLDASTLIPWLARGNSGYTPARLLMDRLQSTGATLVTTTLFVEEVAEHARWAQRQVSAGNELSLNFFELATGRAGARTNSFMEGYVAARAEAIQTLGFDQYIADCLDMLSVSRPLSNSDVIAGLKSAGITVLNVTGAADPVGISAIDAYQIKIRDRLSCASRSSFLPVNLAHPAVLPLHFARFLVVRGLDGGLSSSQQEFQLPTIAHD